MTDIVIRWNTGFIRGLAQSVLERAKNIRTSLTGVVVTEAKPTATPMTATKAKARKTSATGKKRLAKTKTKRRTSRRKNG